MNLHFKAILRRLVKNKYSSLINVLGLGVGIATTLLLLLYVQHESTYDQFHKKSDNLYQVFVKWGEGEQYWLAPPLAQAIEEGFPEVEKVARFTPWDDEWLIVHDTKSFKINSVMGADNEIFDLLTFDFVIGNPQHALDRPKTVVLTETTANKIFGRDDPLGRSIIANGYDTLEVTGVVRDVPKSSSLQFNMLHSIKGVFGESNWMNHTLYTFILLNDQASVNTLSSKMPAFTKETLDPYFQERDGRTYEDFVKGEGLYQYDFKLFTDVHLSTVLGGKQTLKSRLNILLLIGLLIFAIACINYTNLSTIQIITRAKEVGIKKVTGSSVFRLFLSSYLETSLIVVAALFLGGLLMIWALPYFNALTGKELTLQFLKNPVLLLGFPSALIIATIIAGSYPAFKLARISPTAAFKGVISQKPKAFSFRNVLIVGQFVVCIAMISITILFSKQIDYISQKQLGFDPEQILVIKDAFLAETGPFKQAVLNIPNIEAASYSNTIPGRHFNDQGIHVKGAPAGSKHAHVFTGDYHLKDIFNLELVAGRWFSEDIEKDKATCILNETAIKNLNIEDPLNTILDDGSWSYDSIEEGRVIGVVKDFNFKSLQSTVETMAIYPGAENQFYDNMFLNLKISQSNYQEVISEVKEIWDQQTGNLPFEYFFLDQDFNKNYLEEAKLRSIFLWFSSLAIFVTCLGLLGLSSFLILRRTKEIGIRKVTGANIPQIIRMLNYDFIKLVVVAFLIASPIAYIVANRWLENFAYKTGLSWWVFALAGLLAIAIAIVTVSWQSWKAAVRNPVDALRYE